MVILADVRFVVLFRFHGHLPLARKCAGELCVKTRGKRYSADSKREALRRASEEYVTDVLVAEELVIKVRQLLYAEPFQLVA